MSGFRGRFKRWSKATQERIRREQATIIRNRCGKRVATMTNYLKFVCEDHQRGTVVAVSLIPSPRMTMTSVAIRTTNQISHGAWQWNNPNRNVARYES